MAYSRPALSELLPLQRKFKMLTLKTIMSQIWVGDWFVTVDLKDAYFHIRVIRWHRKFLHFAFGAKACNTRFFPLAWLWHWGRSQIAWMLLWLLWGSRVFVYSTTWMIDSFWPTPGSQWAVTGMSSSATFMLLASEWTQRRVLSPFLNELCSWAFTWIPFKCRPIWLLPGFPASIHVWPTSS